MAKKNDNNGTQNPLEGQIGSIGNEPEVQEQQSLGKLRNTDLILGKPDTLTPEEQSRLDGFLDRSRKKNEAADDAVVSFNSISGGWVPIDRTRMGIRGKFYPEDWQFRVRPATVDAIKNWSAIDESNAFAVNNVFNEVIKQCVSIQSSTGAVSWQKINSWDRFWFLLLVREYTFAKGEQKIEFEEECIECNSKIVYNLTADSLYYEFPDEEVIETNWNSADKCWYINPFDYGVDDMGMIKMFCPTLEKDDMILKWAIAETDAKHDVSQTLLKFLPWLVERASKDTDNAKRIIEKAKKVYESWNTDQFAFMNDVLKNIIVIPKETLKQKCPHCGEVVHSDVRFPNGISNLFTVQNRFKKFGSK